MDRQLIENQFAFNILKAMKGFKMEINERDELVVNAGGIEWTQIYPNQGCEFKDALAGITWRLCGKG